MLGTVVAAAALRTRTVAVAAGPRPGAVEMAAGLRTRTVAVAAVRRPGTVEVAAVPKTRTDVVVAVAKPRDRQSSGSTYDPGVPRLVCSATCDQHDRGIDCDGGAQPRLSTETVM